MRLPILAITTMLCASLVHAAPFEAAGDTTSNSGATASVTSSVTNLCSIDAFDIDATQLEMRAYVKDKEALMLANGEMNNNGLFGIIRVSGFDTISIQASDYTSGFIAPGEGVITQYTNFQLIDSTTFVEVDAIEVTGTNIADFTIAQATYGLNLGHIAVHSTTGFTTIPDQVNTTLTITCN